MNESNGVLTFSLLNQFKRPVTAYMVRVWIFRDGIPKPLCALTSHEVSSPEERIIEVSGSCVVPKDPATGDLLPYTAKLTAVRADGRLTNYESIRMGKR